MTKSLSSLPSRHQVSPGPVEQKAGDKYVNRCQKDVIDGRLVLASPRRVTGPQHHDEVRAVAGEIAYRWRDKWQKTLQREKKKIEFQNGDDVPLFTSQSAPGCPGTGEQKAGDK
ncbi:hypothetical protein N7455_008580 [Penicillium solitum]|uniref:uncharacterized protein n=1 Tax=Penicillium solitum TaxID=60172 RepID=UPI0032C42A5F|nr:hypothetical protein N7455_008580 [Penicillium solitum]